ncbi:c-type cytochrome [Aquabacterium sp. A08]|uniref:c-type cytochrome n=1 Tax=Aquabacterium sp. A08 TaxID=2718532 RepID=UPI0014247C71|nr:c-type cytochrome [Aquabacterium sp. A08]NIC43763.1 c-type cytochrome [Aquabacterium sp. A08]
MKTFSSCLATLIVLTSGLAAAQNADVQARAWAASCAACHGTQGQGASTGIPSLAGQSQAALLQKLLAFKRDQLPATVMHQHAKGYTDAELERIAAHFAQQSR